MRTRLATGLSALGRWLRALPRLLFAAAARLVRLMLRLPGLLWRVSGALLFHLWRLPGRLWRGLRASARFVISLPRRILYAWRRSALALYRARLRMREGRARLVHWWRSRIYRPRTMSPRAQLTVLLASFIIVGIVTLAIVDGLRSARGDNERGSVTAGAESANSQSLTLNTPIPTHSNPRPNPPSSQAPSSLFGGGGEVAFSLRRDSNSDIYVRRIADDQLLRLTYHPGVDREPDWAPDGETLAFASNRSGNWDIYRMDLVSGVLIRLTRDSHYDAHPSWSPDGAFITFESFRSGNLDLYIMAADGSEVHQLTASQAADFAPAWSPDGRHIAFVSYRDGSRDVFLYPLDAGTESAATNLTQTPDRDEDGPTWSPDGSRLAFSVGRFDSQTVYITTFDWSSNNLDEAQTQVYNPGARPDWSPDGSSLIFEYRRAGQTYLIAESVAGWGAGREVFRADLHLRDPSWSIPTIDTQILARQRESSPMASAAAYIEEILPLADASPSYTIVALKNVNGGDDREFLSDRVNDSFQALRQRVLQETGTDYLATIGDSFRAITVEPPPGQSPHSWHKAGRAFDLNQGLYEREEQLVELVREDIGFRTYWRVYIRAARQDGSLGEPLHKAAWDLKARQEGGLATREGGELRENVPPGYYVDFTELAADYGWERVPASSQWRSEWADTNWWQFQKTQGLSWVDAMLELYRVDQFEAVYGPVEDNDHRGQ